MPWARSTRRVTLTLSVAGPRRDCPIGGRPAFARLPSRRRRTGSRQRSEMRWVHAQLRASSRRSSSRSLVLAACSSGGTGERPAPCQPAAEADPAAAAVVPAGPVRRLLRGPRQGLLRATRASTSRSCRARSRSCRRRSSPAARPSSASAGCRACSPRASRARTCVVIGQVFQRSPTLQVSFKDKNITKPEDLQGQEGRRVGLRQRGRAVRRHAQGRASTRTNPTDVTIVPQQFDMVAFVQPVRSTPPRR